MLFTFYKYTPVSIIGKSWSQQENLSKEATICPPRLPRADMKEYICLRINMEAKSSQCQSHTSQQITLLEDFQDYIHWIWIPRCHPWRHVISYETSCIREYKSGQIAWAQQQYRATFLHDRELQAIGCNIRIRAVVQWSRAVSHLQAWQESVQILWWA